VLKLQMRRLGLFAGVGFVLGWGIFMLLALPLDDVPQPLLWLAGVVALAASLSATAALIFRIKNRR
jgi:hypothetical protein